MNQIQAIESPNDFLFLTQPEKVGTIIEDNQKSLFDMPNNLRGFDDALSRIENFGVNVVDRITDAPNELNRLSDRLNFGLQRTFKRFSNRSEKVATKNLTTATISSKFGAVGRWLQDPINSIPTVGIFVVLYFFIRSLRKGK